MTALTALVIGALTVAYILSSFGLFMMACYLFRERES